MQQPVLTVFCAFSRRWAVDSWIEGFKKVEHDPELTNLCFIIDGDEPYISNMLKKLADQGNYRSLSMRMNDNWSPYESTLSVRRERVAFLHHQSKDLIFKTDSHIIIGLEDDVVFDRIKSFERLYVPLLKDAEVGFVEGVQMGRWGAKIIGAWLKGSSVIETMLPPLAGGTQEIDAGGFYGFATRKELWLDHEYHASPSQPWGPDVNFGLWITKMGYLCLIDWDVVFGHRDHNVVLWPDEHRLTKAIFTKRVDNGKWERTDHDAG